MKLAYVLLAGVVGCSASGVGRPGPHPTRLVVDPAIAEQTVAAVEMWSRATAGGYAPEIVISDTCDATHAPEGVSVWCVRSVPEITGCHAPHPWGCSEGTDSGTVRISTITPASCLVDTLAHEIGHTQGLTHEAPQGDLMDPARVRETRLHTCVSAGDVAAAGFEGPGTCG